LPRAALGKGFAEGLRGFAESLGPSAKQPAPVVPPLLHSKLQLVLVVWNFLHQVGPRSPSQCCP
jgi:hypothetical protein